MVDREVTDSGFGKQRVVSTPEPMLVTSDNIIKCRNLILISLLPPKILGQREKCGNSKATVSSHRAF